MVNTRNVLAGICVPGILFLAVCGRDGWPGGRPDPIRFLYDTNPNQTGTPHTGNHTRRQPQGRINAGDASGTLRVS
jgi:hypothetical protein